MPDEEIWMTQHEANCQFPDKWGLILQDLPKAVQWSCEITEYLFEAKLKVQSRQTLTITKQKLLLWL